MDKKYLASHEVLFVCLPFEDTLSYETLSFNRLVGFHFYSIKRLIFWNMSFSEMTNLYNS